MSNNYHFNQGSQKRSPYYNNKKSSTRNNYNYNNNNFDYNKALEENKRLKMELHQKTNVLNDYNSRIEILREELNRLKNSQNRKFTKSNTIQVNNYNNNNRNRGKSNTNMRIPSNNFNYYDPFDDIINSGLGNFIFEDILPNRNIQRINPNFNPGDYEDYYENNNVNHLIRGPNNNNFNNFGMYNNNVDDSTAEQDIIDQLYPDPDKMTYEQLLELEENVGSVSKGLTKKQIKKIPKVIYNKNKFKGDDNKCVVCQYEFKNGENVTKLPCGHLFHSECVDTWLSKNKVCPMCHKEIVI